MLQQKERDDARLFFRKRNHPFLFALTHKPTASAVINDTVSERNANAARQSYY